MPLHVPVENLARTADLAALNPGQVFAVVVGDNVIAPILAIRLVGEGANAPYLVLAPKGPGLTVFTEPVQDVLTLPGRARFDVDLSVAVDDERGVGAYSLSGRLYCAVEGKPHIPIDPVRWAVTDDGDGPFPFVRRWRIVLDDGLPRAEPVVLAAGPQPSYFPRKG